MQYSFNSRLHITCSPEGFAFYNFLQHNSISNCHDSILDLVSSNPDDLVVEPTPEPLVPLDSYHPAIVSPILSFINSNESYNSIEVVTMK